jgi:hypothetical protein
MSFARPRCFVCGGETWAAVMRGLRVDPLYCCGEEHCAEVQRIVKEQTADWPRLTPEQITQFVDYVDGGNAGNSIP